MTNLDIFQLIDRFEQSSLGTLELSVPEFTLKLKRMEGTAGVPAPAPLPAPQAAEKREEKGDTQTIDAPLLGTFYAAPAPDQPPFVSAGSRVEKGQTVCLIEAMKMISEIPAPCDCVIEEVLKADGQLADFKEPLFGVRPCGSGY